MSEILEMTEAYSVTVNEEELKKNSSGYPDPTAYDAIKSVEEESRFHKLLNTLYYISNLAGFDISERIVLTDRETGKVWR